MTTPVQADTKPPRSLLDLNDIPLAVLATSRDPMIARVVHRMMGTSEEIVPVAMFGSSI